MKMVMKKRGLQQLCAQVKVHPVLAPRASMCLRQNGRILKLENSPAQPNLLHLLKALRRGTESVTEIGMTVGKEKKEEMSDGKGTEWTVGMEKKEEWDLRQFNLDKLILRSNQMPRYCKVHPRYPQYHRALLFKCRRCSRCKCRKGHKFKQWPRDLNSLHLTTTHPTTHHLVRWLPNTHRAVLPWWLMGQLLIQHKCLNE